MDLLVGTVAAAPVRLRVPGGLPASPERVDLGWRRDAAFAGCVWPVAWLAGVLVHPRPGSRSGSTSTPASRAGASSTSPTSRFIDSLSFTFLAYAAFCLARVALAAADAVAAGDGGGGRRAHDGARRRDRSARGARRPLVPRARLQLRGARRLLRRAAVELRGVGDRRHRRRRPLPGLSSRRASAAGPRPATACSATTASSASGRRAWPGVALYYARARVQSRHDGPGSASGWLAVVGAAIHVAVACHHRALRPEARRIALGPESEGIQRA